MLASGAACQGFRFSLGFGSFRKLGVPYFGVLTIRSYYLGYYIRVPYFRKPPFRASGIGGQGEDLGLVPLGKDVA